jgi:MinD superfamily P-loop ATPase
VVVERGRDLCLVSAEVTFEKKESPGSRKKGSSLGRSRLVWPKSKAGKGNAQRLVQPRTEEESSEPHYITEPSPGVPFPLDHSLVKFDLVPVVPEIGSRYLSSFR